MEMGFHTSDVRFSYSGAASPIVWSDFFTIKNTGNIGINTTNPTQKLHVNGGAQLDAVSFGVTPGSTQTLGLTTVEYVNAKVGGSGGITTGTSGQTLRHDGTSWVANSTLFNNGTNVGIGTTAPGAKLEVSGTAGTSTADTNGMIINTTNSGGNNNRSHSGLLVVPNFITNSQNNLFIYGVKISPTHSGTYN